MGGASFQPEFKSFAELQSEPAKGSLNPNSNVEQALHEEAAEASEALTISMYQDPRDELDFERHQRGGIGSKPIVD